MQLLLSATSLSGPEGKMGFWWLQVKQEH